MNVSDDRRAKDVMGYIERILQWMQNCVQGKCTQTHHTMPCSTWHLVINITSELYSWKKQEIRLFALCIR